MGELGIADLVVQFECWGWGSGALHNLGHFELATTKSGSNAEFNLTDPALGTKLSIALNEGAIPYLGDLDEGKAGLISVLLLPPTGWSTEPGDIESCLAYASLSDPTYCSGDDWEFPYTPTYVIWNWEFKSKCGVLGPCIIDPTNLEHMAEFPGEYGVNVELLYPWFFTAASFEGTFHSVFKPPPGPGCGTTYTVRLRTYFIPEGYDTMIESAPELVTVAAPCPAADYAVLGVEFTALKIDDYMEEPEEGEVIEICAGFTAMVDVVHAIGMGNNVTTNCPLPDGDPPSGRTNWSAEFPLEVQKSNPYLLANQYLCVTTFTGCSEPYKLGNNEFTVIINEGQSLWLTAAIYDFDVNSPHDLVCFAQHTITRSPQSWNNPPAPTYDKHQAFLVQGFNGTGSCVVLVEINPLGFYDAP